MLIREIQADEADIFLNLKKQLDEETEFMMLEPGERKTTAENQRRQIERIRASYNSTIIVAESEGKLVGYIEAIGGYVTRNKHCAYLVIGVLQDYTRQGVGSMLFKELFTWAEKHRIHRMELTVLVHNHAASVLYHRMGFEIEGLKQRSLRINGKFVDEYYMAKLL
jgi:RimJ/RimL family protein N-acetyltransferase